MSLKETLSDDVLLSIKKITDNVRIARNRRGLSMRDVSEQTGVSYPTMVRVERGDPGLAVGTFLTVLKFYGFLDDVVLSTSPDKDELGKRLELENLRK